MKKERRSKERDWRARKRRLGREKTDRELSMSLSLPSLSTPLTLKTKPKPSLECSSTSKLQFFPLNKTPRPSPPY